MPNAPCPMPHAQCPMPNAPCPMPHAQTSKDIAAAIAVNIAKLTKEIKIKAS
ncbi:MAG: hypothetical protein V7L05_11150 [Nostoc sp.]|uniref:hypothetical protein n=1 Tax=Nostoc sp. TaxID=1180 RepID=UPI002FFBC3B8